MKLPKIYDHFRKGQIFTIEEAREKLQTTGNTLRKRLSELAARGYIYPIRQGLYRVSALGEAADRMKSSPFAVAAKLTPYCYVGFKSALQLHARELPPEQDTVYIVSPTKFNAFSFEGRNYFWCQAPEPHGLLTTVLRDDHVEFPVLVTTFEKSIVDCLRRLAHCPSFPELARLCTKIEGTPNLDSILQYAFECQVAALFNRLGFFLEHMQETWEVSPDFLAEVERHISRKQTEWPFEVEAGGNRDSMDLNADGELTTRRRARWRVQFSPTTKSEHAPSAWAQEEASAS